MTHLRSYKPRPKWSCLTGVSAPLYSSPPLSTLCSSLLLYSSPPLSTPLYSSTPLLLSCPELAMAFRKALKWTLMVGGGGGATALGLSQLAEYRKKQVSCPQVDLWSAGPGLFPEFLVAAGC